MNTILLMIHVLVAVVLPDGKIMVTDVIPGTKISNTTVTYGPHGNVGR
jgi:hypothetical protein